MIETKQATESGFKYERRFLTEGGAQAFASYMVKPWPTFVTNLVTLKVRESADMVYWVVRWNGKF